MHACKIIGYLLLITLFATPDHACQKIGCLPLSKKQARSSLFHTVSRWNFQEWVTIWYHRYKKRHDPTYQKKLNQELFSALHRGKLRNLQLYYASGADINGYNDQDEVPLQVNIHLAHIHKNMKCYDADLACFYFLMTCPHININVQSTIYKQTPLMLATIFNLEAHVQQLLQAGAYLFITDIAKQTVEQYANDYPAMQKIVQPYTDGIKFIQHDLEEHIRSKEGDARGGTQVATPITNIIREYV